MRKITLLLIFCSVVNLFAQKTNSKKINLTGTVLEKSTQQPLEYATLVLTNLKTKRVLGGVTNTKGIFSVDAPNGLYNVSIEFIGFKTQNLGDKNITKNTNLGTIYLSEDAETLDEIEIIAEKSTVEIRLDKKIFNVGKDMTLKGGSASDVLDNVPSVTVDSEGAVSLRGNDNVRILINGKPSALSGLSGTDALANLPADAIEKVEVITSPSARYDAEGTAGILNIILRKGKITGLNGSLGITVGIPDRLNIAPNLNYRTKRINLFTNLGYSYREGPGTADYKTSFLDDLGEVTSYTIQDRDFDRSDVDYNSRIGLEFYINKKSSITASYAFQDSDEFVFSENIINTGTNLNSLNFDSKRDLYEDELGNTKQYSLNYINNFNDKGHKLIADLQYSDSFEEQFTEIFEDDIFISTSDEFSRTKNYLLQLDYVLPFAKNSQLELGHKVDAERTASNFDTTDSSDNLVEQVLNFDQTIYAYYAQYGNKLNKLNYLIGLRAETTEVDFELESNNGINSIKNYTELFPTLNLGYKINDNDNFTVGYNRRLRRPRSRFLNPFPSQSSATFIFQGNPDLNPTFTNAFEIGYNTKIKKLNLGSSVYYQSSKNPFSVISRTIENGTIEIRQPINLDSENRYGFEFTTNYNPTKWLRLSGNFNFFGFKTDAFVFSYLDEGITQNLDLEEVESTSWFARFNSKITLPGEIQWQTRLMYSAPQKRAQSDQLAQFNTDLAFSKDLFKDKATLTLNVKNLFNTRKFELITYNENRENTESITDLSLQRRIRQISLNFTYRFNQKKKKENTGKGQQDNQGGGF